ncbi:hypothetical protein CUMW_183880 [Citrus unshiu]|uniref:Uncharacterized protein n=1 Tax=Citrus unshiu TaxID=55188 RepID=A0A2H5Q060_CITUN|nr:hypothetical protein CUMW_183880 [Citrus unshiu]
MASKEAFKTPRSSICWQGQVLLGHAKRLCLQLLGRHFRPSLQMNGEHGGKDLSPLLLNSNRIEQSSSSKG